MSRSNFCIEQIKSSAHLESVLLDNFDEKNVYYLIINSWDDVCNNFMDMVNSISNDERADSLYIIDIFDVPNALSVMKSVIKEERESWFKPLSDLNYSSNLPLLIITQKGFPLVIDYNGVISAELGL